MSGIDTAGEYSSKDRYKLLQNKYAQILKRWCWFCDEETNHGMWEDGKPDNLLSGRFGEFFCQCKTCGSFTEWKYPGDLDLPRAPKYAIKINRWEPCQE